jgi:hypothetical protein
MNLESLTAKYPSERESLRKLAELLRRGEHAEYTLNRLSDLVEPNSKEALAGALGELVRSGEIKFVIRVISPRAQGGIKDFESVEEVPAIVYDRYTDTELEVTPENLRLLYRT